MVEVDGRSEGGFGFEKRSRRRHMWSVPSTTTSPPQHHIIVPAVSSSSSSTPCFLKDGCEINVGECALFKLAQDSPPLVGIIRSFTSDKETSLTLGVNWLYRPAGVKLLRGVALEAAPNEVFYTFHRDEIPAVSFLHRCKVAFLPKGVELPAGVSSFVCRRVYDITNSCLWWLTDQDYIDVRQEEVDQLLHKTIVEMHASVDQQQGTRSPKLMNGSVATSPQKHSPDGVQNSGSNFSSQTKGKKRDRGDHSSEPIKRERSDRGDDGDSGQLRSESARNFEIAKLTEKGRLVDFDAVARLVRLMQPEKFRWKIDLKERSMFAGIIAATDKHDCLRQFVQLKGIPVLDEWLQEVQKGKYGGSGNLKDSEKAVENFLLVLLGALDKLPINLNALQMCNIGKSVNHLRSHKNSDIQKRARSLVDIWKKRVEAEMNMTDAKSGSGQMVPWPGKSRDGSHSGNKHSGGSSEAVIRCAATHQSSLKLSPVKHLLVETNSKPGSTLQSNGKTVLSPASTTPNINDTHSRATNGGSFEPPPMVIREEKSSSSSPSHTNSQCSTDHARSMVPFGKEDARRSTAAAKKLKKAAGSGSRDRKSANGAIPGVNKETMPNRSSSIGRSSLVEEASQNVVDGSVHEGSIHKLIVKIPSRGHGPAESIVGASADDISCRNSGVSSPAVPEKHDQLRKHDSHQFSEVDGSSAIMHPRPHDTRRLANIVKPAYSPDRNPISSDPRISTNNLKPVYSVDRNDKKSRKAHDSSFSSMNALVESCVKFSEANALMSAGDDVGMNLLASVAAGEICRAISGSPAASPHKNSTTAKNSGNLDSTTEKQLCDADVMNQGGLAIEVADTVGCNIASCAPKVNDEGSDKDLFTAEDVPPTEEGCLRNEGVLGEQVSTACTTGRNIIDASAKAPSEREGDVTGESHSQLTVATQIVGSDVEAEAKVKIAFVKTESEEKSFEDALCASVDCKDDLKSNACTGPKSYCSVEQNSTIVPLSESLSRDEKLAVQHLDALYSTIKSEEAGGVDICDNGGVAVKETLDQEKQEDPGVCSADVTRDTDCKVDKLDDKDAVVQQFLDSGTPVSSSGDICPEELHSSTKEANMIAVDAERKEDSAVVTVVAASSPGARGLDVDAKLKFDLNESLNLDDGKYKETLCLSATSFPANGCSANPLEVPVSSASGCLLASVTVAAPTQGLFVPNVDLSRNKLEFGWKGSAATSAFRPAEPRKVVELPPGPSKVLHPDGTASKQSRLPLDIDLNVADESYDEEANSKYNSVAELRTSTSLRGSGGLDLDLNIADEAPNLIQQSAGSSQGCNPVIPSVQPLASNIFFNGEVRGKRDFDLNDGPTTEEMLTERTSLIQPTCNSIPLRPASGYRISSPDSGNLFSWYPPGTSYSGSMTQSALHDRQAFAVVGMGSGPHHIRAGPTSSLPFNQDAFRGSVLSSSPSMPFPSVASQYPVFPFGTSFSLPTSALACGPSGYVDMAASGRISAFPSQLAGNAMTVPFQYPHAYAVSRPIDNGAIESNQKCGKQGLDLNSGSGSLDLEWGNESLPAVSRQISIIGSQPLVEEQARMYGMGGGAVKRKEPEGGWSIDKHGSETWWR